MAHGYRIILVPPPGVHVAESSLRIGSRAASRALSTFDNAWMARLQPLAGQRRQELEGADYLDSSVLEYALYKGLEAAFPEMGGEPVVTLSRESFTLRIVERNSSA